MGRREGCSWEKGLKTGEICSVPSVLTVKREMRVFIRKGSGGRSWVLENMLGIWVTSEGCWLDAFLTGIFLGCAGTGNYKAVPGPVCIVQVSWLTLNWRVTRTRGHWTYPEDMQATCGPRKRHEELSWKVTEP